MAEQQNLSLIKRLHNSPKIQFILMVLAIAYVMSPVDAVPDVMPIVGQLDDGGIILAEIAQFLIYLKNKRQAVVNTQNTAKSANPDQVNNQQNDGENK